VRAAIYLRLSDDRQGTGLGVTRQREDCERLVAQRGWQLVGTYEDNDLSAYSGKPRPGYERLLEAVRAREVDVIVAWDPDRLHRSPRELEDFVELLQSTGTSVETVTAGTYDLSTPAGRMTARIIGATARAESEHKAARQRRKHEELARAGMVGGGGSRPFGYEADRVTVNLEEADLIREAARRLLAGEAMHSILTDWGRRGVRTVSGKPWRTTTLRRVLQSPRIAGLRQLRGEVVADAVWPTIIDRATHERIRGILADPARRRGGHPREYLLTGGLCRCSLCGVPLVARPKADGRRCYCCVRGVDFSGCGRIRALADRLEEHVRDVVLAALDGPGLTTALRAATASDGRQELPDRLRTDEDALEQLAVDHYHHRLIGRAEFLAARHALESSINVTRRALRQRTGAGVLADLSPGSAALGAAWEAGSIGWRRALLAAVLERVEVGPAVRGRNFFDPERVKFVWRF
jgi:site-specific DNA recombinase